MRVRMKEAKSYSTNNDAQSQNQRIKSSLCTYTYIQTNIYLTNKPSTTAAAVKAFWRAFSSFLCSFPLFPLSIHSFIHSCILSLFLFFSPCVYNRLLNHHRCFAFGHGQRIRWTTTAGELWWSFDRPSLSPGTQYLLQFCVSWSSSKTAFLPLCPTSRRRIYGSPLFLYTYIIIIKKNRC